MIKQQLVSQVLIAIVVASGIAGCTSLTPNSSDWTGKRQAAQEAAKEGKSSAAIQSFQDALTDAEGFGNADVRLAQSLNDLSEQFMRSGQQEKCLGLFKRAWNLCDDRLPLDPPEVGQPARIVKHSADDDRKWALEGVRACAGLMKVYSDLGSYGATKEFYGRCERYCDLAGDPNLKQKLQSDYQSIERHITQTEQSFDDAIAVTTTHKFVSRDRNQMLAQFSDFRDRVSKSAPYPVAAAKLTTLLTQAKSALGVRDTDYRDLLGTAFMFYCSNGQYSQAKQLLEDDAKNFATCESIDTGTAEISPEDIQEGQRLSRDLNMLATAEVCSKEPDKAIASLKRAIAVLQKFRVDDTAVRDLHAQLGALLYGVSGNEVEAERQLQAAVSMYKGTTPPFDLQCKYLMAQAELRKKDKAYAAAISLLEQSERLANVHSEEDYRAMAYQMMGDVYMHQKVFDKAASAFKEAMAIEEKLLSKHGNMRMADLLHLLAECYQSQSLFSQARASALREYELISTCPAAQKPGLYTRTLGLLGSIEDGAGNTAASEKYYKEGLSRSEKLKDDAATTEYLLWLGNLADTHGHTAEADLYLDRALAMIDHGAAKDWPHLAIVVLRVSGWNNCCHGKMKLSIEQLQKAEALTREEARAEKTEASQLSEDLLWTPLNLATVLPFDGRLAESQKYFDEAWVQIDSKNLTNEDVAHDYYWRRALTYYLQGDDKKAKEFLQKASACTKKTPADFLKTLHEQMTTLASLWGLPKPDLSRAGLLPSALVQMKALERSSGTNSYFSAASYINLAWSFKTAGLIKEADALQEMGHSILLKLKPTS